MKIITSLILSTGLMVGGARAGEQPPRQPEASTEVSTRLIDTNNGTDKVEGTLPSTSPTNTTDQIDTSPLNALTNAAPAGENPDLAASMAEDNGTNGLRLNFRGASL